MRKTLVTALGVLLIAGSAAQMTSASARHVARTPAATSEQVRTTQAVALRALGAVGTRAIPTTRTSIPGERPLGANSERGTAETIVRKGATSSESMRR